MSQRAGDAAASERALPDEQHPQPPELRMHKGPWYWIGWVAVWLFLVAIVAGAAFLGVVGTRPLPYLPVTAEKIPPTHPIALSWSGQSSVAVGTADGGVKATAGSQAQRPTASIAKVITVLVVASVHPLAVGSDGASITMGAADVAQIGAVESAGGVALPVSRGQVWTQRQMLDGILLVSANNLANSYAIWAFGSMRAYHDAAMNWLAAQGLKNTVVGSDACGLDPATRSTPSDLFALGTKLMADPGLRDIVSQQHATGPGGLALDNTNALIGQDGFIGIKTGTMSVAGYCLLFANKLQVDGQTVLVIGVVLNEPSDPARFQAAQALVAFMKNNIVPTDVVAGQTFGYVTDLDGHAVPIVAASGIPGVRMRDQIVTVRLTVTRLDMPVADGTPVGTVTVGDTTVPLVVGSAIPSGDLGWRLEHLHELIW